MARSALRTSWTIQSSFLLTSGRENWQGNRVSASRAGAFCSANRWPTWNWKQMAQILDGNRVRDEIKNECRPRVERLIARKRPPGLVVVLVGHNPASEIYVRNKVKTSHELGIHSETITPPESITTAELLAIVE